MMVRHDLGRSALAALLAISVVGAGCSPDSSSSDGGTGWDGRPDGGPRPDADGPVRDTGTDSSPDSTIDPCAIQTCGAEELCGAEGRGDGLDNDCDGTVDEECACTPMTDSMECFPGDPAMLNVGTCSAGVQNCSEFGIWGSCIGAVASAPETCDGMDNDCDGSVDEDLAGCETIMMCPGVQTSSPLASFPLLGSEIYDRGLASWNWRVTCPPTVPAESCPQPRNATAQDTEVYFIASGTYRVTATVVPQGEASFECSFAVIVQGGGLRVELNWDTQGEGRGDTDVDLHLHRPGPPSDWFTTDDCFYHNCKATSYSIDWGLPPTSLSGCALAPQGQGDRWTEIGQCYNPRLDVDVVHCDPSITDATDDLFCAPENINVDNPNEGDVFRIMVNYYSAHDYAGDTHPSVNIYCGGGLRASFGTAGEVVLRNGSSGDSQSNDSWHVADVRFFTGECGALSCEVEPLSQIETSPDFGAPWSW